MRILDLIAEQRPDLLPEILSHTAQVMVQAPRFVTDEADLLVRIHRPREVVVLKFGIECELLRRSPR